jgi:hypothetical protein
MDQINNDEIGRVFGNCITYKSASSEFVALDDLFDGLKLSGYRFSKEQDSSERMSLPFLIIEKSNVRTALEEICGEEKTNLGTMCSISGNIADNKVFNMRFFDSQYHEGKLGYHPSRILSSEDIIANPALMIFLLGEMSPFSFYAGRIGPIDDSSIKITGICSSSYKMAELNPNSGKPTIILDQDAKSIAEKQAINILSDLPDICLDAPQHRFSYLSTTLFRHEWSMKSRLSLSFDDLVLSVDNVPLYRTEIVNYTEQKLEKLRRNLGLFLGGPKKRKQMLDGIAQYEDKLASGKSEYYSVIRLIK